MTTKPPFFIAGPAGLIESTLTVPDQAAKPTIGIVCHPNPVEGGTMNNKVVTTIARAFERLGVTTVRFNYRGVGQSQGQYGHVTGEIDDLRAVVAWVQQEYPQHDIWLAGFSFGSFIAASVAQELDTVKQLVTIAPAVNRHDFTVFSQMPCPWLVVASDADEIVPYLEVKSWLDQPPSPIESYIFQGVSHFFHGQLIPLRQRLIESLSTSN
jgi:uncharacterized protein